MQILVALLLAVLIGLTLGAVGGGGSILAVPVLVGVAGLAVTEATTASLIVVGTSSAIGLLAALRSGSVRVPTGVAFGLAGIGGAAIGTRLNRGLDEGVLLIGFAMLMAVVAAKMLHGLAAGNGLAAGPRSERTDGDRTPGGQDTYTMVGPNRTDPSPAAGIPVGSVEFGAIGSTSSADDRDTLVVTAQVPPSESAPRQTGPAATILKVLAAGSLVGLLTGLFGVGGGFVIVPALMFLLGFDIRSATATSLLVIAINSAVALVLRADLASVAWDVVAPFTALSTVGVLLGRRIADRVPRRTLSAVLTVLITVMALWTAAQGVSQII